MKITEIKKYPLAHDGRISLYIEVLTAVSYTHLTLPTNREV